MSCICFGSVELVAISIYGACAAICGIVCKIHRKRAKTCCGHGSRPCAPAPEDAPEDPPSD